MPTEATPYGPIRKVGAQYQLAYLVIKTLVLLCVSDYHYIHPGHVSKPIMSEVYTSTLGGVAYVHCRSSACPVLGVSWALWGWSTIIIIILITYVLQCWQECIMDWLGTDC